MKADEKLVLSDTDFVSVFMGKDQDAPVLRPFKNHPRVQWIAAENGVPIPDVLAQVASNSKAFLLTSDIPTAIYDAVTNEARRRNLLYLNKRNPHALLTQLYDLFPRQRLEPETKESTGGTDASRGRITRLVEEFPPAPGTSAAEHGRKLFAIAKERNIVSTLGSLEQATRIYQRKHSLGDRPASARPKDRVAEATAMLDDAIAQLQLMREWVAETHAENVRLREAKEATDSALKKLLGVEV